MRKERLIDATGVDCNYCTLLGFWVVVDYCGLSQLSLGITGYEIRRRSICLFMALRITLFFFTKLCGKSWFWNSFWVTARGNRDPSAWTIAPLGFLVYAALGSWSRSRGAVSRHSNVGDADWDVGIQHRGSVPAGLRYYLYTCICLPSFISFYRFFFYNPLFHIFYLFTFQLPASFMGFYLYVCISLSLQFPSYRIKCFLLMTFLYLAGLSLLLWYLDQKIALGGVHRAF